MWVPLRNMKVIQLKHSWKYLHVLYYKQFVFLFLNCHYDNMLTFWSHRDPVPTAYQLTVYSSATNKSTHTNTLTDLQKHAVLQTKTVWDKDVISLQTRKYSYPQSIAQNLRRFYYVSVDSAANAAIVARIWSIQNKVRHVAAFL